MSNGTLPAISTSEPNSPRARENARPLPPRTAGTRFGKTMRRKMVRGPAPSEAAACSMSRSSSISTGWTARTTKGRETSSNATTMPARVKARFRPTGLLGP